MQRDDLLLGKPLDVEHAAAVEIGDGDDRVCETPDQMAVECFPDRLSFERPCVLVSNDDGNARGSSQKRSPDIRTELVGMENVDPLRAEDREESLPRPQIDPPPAVEREHMHPRVGEFLPKHRIGGPRRAQIGLEALGIQVRGYLCGDTFRSSRRREVVDHRQHAKPANLVPPRGAPFGRARRIVIRRPTSGCDTRLTAYGVSAPNPAPDPGDQLGASRRANGLAMKPAPHERCNAASATGIRSTTRAGLRRPSAAAATARKTR